MQRDNCERCQKPTNGTTTMSMFNTQVICMECKEEETKHPDYNKAREADITAWKNREMYYEGIGLPEDLKLKYKNI